MNGTQMKNLYISLAKIKKDFGKEVWKEDGRRIDSLFRKYSPQGNKEAGFVEIFTKSDVYVSFQNKKIVSDQQGRRMIKKLEEETLSESETAGQLFIIFAMIMEVKLENRFKNYSQILFHMTKELEVLLKGYEARKEFKEVVETTTVLMELYGEDFRNSIENCYEKRAKAFFQLQDYFSAEKDYTELIRRGVRRYGVYTGRAEVYKKLEYFKEAEKDYTEAIKLNEKNASAWNTRGVFFSSIFEKQKAEKDFLEAVNITKEEEVFFCNLAEVQIQLKKFKEAAQNIKEAIRLDNKRAWLIKGKLHYHCQEYDLEEECYRTYCDFFSDKADAYLKIAEFISGSCRFKASLKWYDRAIQSDENCIRAWYGKAVASMLSGEHRNQRICFEKLIELEPLNAEWNYGLSRAIISDYDAGDIHFIMKRSKSYCEKAIELNPDYAEAISWKKTFCEGEEKLQCEKQCVKLQPANMEYRRALSLSLEREGRWQEATEIWQEATGLFPKNAKVWYEAAEFLMRKRCLEMAEKFYEKAVELKGEYSYRVALARCKRMLRKWKEAEMIYKDMISEEPSYPASWNGLGDIYSDLGDLKTALYYYEEAFRLDPKNEVYREDVRITKEELGL